MSERVLDNRELHALILELEKRVEALEKAQARKSKSQGDAGVGATERSKPA